MAAYVKPQINLIQDLATPHNNVLIARMKDREDVRVRLWYAAEQDRSRYQWTGDISREHMSASIFGTRLNPEFLWHCLRHRNERYVIVGWANINTKLLHLLFFVLRRPFNHWTDYPNPVAVRGRPGRRFLRWLSYRMLRHSNCRVLAVGKTTIDYFRVLGFPGERLVNLPIFVEVDQAPENLRLNLVQVLSKFEVPDGGFLVSAGSRLIFEKGYDLLIEAVARIRPELRERIRVVIVGSGEQSAILKAKIRELHLETSIRMQDWMSIDEFRTLIACSDVFIHPARFDSYGGTTLSMAAGVPVIGSTGAGAAVDRIEHGVNGFLYEAEDVDMLATLISRLADDPGLRTQMGIAARATALKWHPRVGADILANQTI